MTFLSNKDGSVRIVNDLGIRIDQVEDIFHRTSGFPIADQPHSPTIGASIGDLFGATSATVIVRTEADIVDATRSQRQALLGYGLPYYQRFGNISAVDHVLNDEPLSPCVQRVVPWLRCSTGAIVAHLVKRPNLRELVDIYRQRLALVSGGFYSERFEKLLQDLQSGSGSKKP